MDFDLERTIDVLERTPRVLRALLDDLPDSWAHGDEGPETFSPYDVVGHLIHGERTDWMPRARMILELGESRPFEPFDRWAHREATARAPLRERLDELEALRSENLAALARLDLGPSDFARTGRHPELGVVTLGQLLATWAAHDLNHIGQIARVMAHQYREAVGPWRAFLGILRRDPEG